MDLQTINKLMNDLDGWGIESNSIIKDFEFSTFKESIDFVNKVGEIAERLNHHPNIVINYNQVHLMISTHEEHGLTEKDFSLAKEIDLGVK